MTDRDHDGSGDGKSRSTDAGGAAATGPGGTDPGRTAESGTGSSLPLPPRSVSRLQSLIDILDAEIAPEYRVELFRLVAPSLLPETAAVEKDEERPPEDRGDAEDLARTSLDLAPYAAVLNQPGKNTLKALAALEAAKDQLGIDWMTPSEVERLLVERAGVRSVYRTNLSNALGKAAGLADRRRRGRGYEYRITPLGRETLHRELLLSGD